jgi:bifunctional DNase/RNase
MIEVSVNGIFLTQTQASGIILKEQNGERTLPIVIGEYEAQSIALALENLKPPRPITHDLTINTLNMIGVKIERVLISELRDNTYYAILTLLKETETLEIDARPSDAIALAVRAGASIFVNEAVMDQASYIPDEKEETDKNYLFKSNANYIESLKLELQKAVESEEYEKAATLRDKIKRLESSS